jgi:hypothetical protein
VAQAILRHFGGAPPDEPDHRRELIELGPADEMEPMMLVDVREARSFRRVA